MIPLVIADAFCYDQCAHTTPIPALPGATWEMEHAQRAEGLDEAIISPFCLPLTASPFFVCVCERGGWFM